MRAGIKRGESRLAWSGSVSCGSAALAQLGYNRELVSPLYKLRESATPGDTWNFLWIVRLLMATSDLLELLLSWQLGPQELQRNLHQLLFVPEENLLSAEVDLLVKLDPSFPLSGW